MFPKKPATAARQAIDSMAGPTFSVFGTDTIIKGDVSASADLHIDGRVEGDIACAALVQGERSTIHGAITAQSARLAGTVHGTITAGELVILKSAQIRGDLYYDTLTIEQGARVDGRLALRGGDAPAAEAGEARLMLAN